MNSPMTDERALELLRWLTNGSDATPPPPDVTLQQAYDHIAARLRGAGEAVAWRFLNPPDEGSTEWVASCWYDYPDEAIEVHKRRGQRIEYAYTTPALPEVTDGDVDAALQTMINGAYITSEDVVRAALKSYRARLMAKAVQS